MVSDIEKNTTEWLRNALPHIRDIFISAAVARKISKVNQRALENVKVRNARSFNGKTLINNCEIISFNFSFNIKSFSYLSKRPSRFLCFNPSGRPAGEHRSIASRDFGLLFPFSYSRAHTSQRNRKTDKNHLYRSQRAEKWTNKIYR